MKRTVMLAVVVVAVTARCESDPRSFGAAPHEFAHAVRHLGSGPAR